MNQLDRFNLLEEIGKELQGRMTFSDIDVYLKGFKVDVSGKSTSGANSKRIYVKEVLADEADSTIAKIADELKIQHTISAAPHQPVEASGYWAPNQFRLFLSHLSSFKATTYQLKLALEQFEITAFVAHESIEPTQEWQIEIEKALFSMDAMAAILMPDFKASNWCDQEVGIAIGRDCLVIPIRRGADPHGFLGKVQGLQAGGKSVAQVAREIFRILANNPKTKGRMFGVLVGEIVCTHDKASLERLINLLHDFALPPTEQMQMLQQKSAHNPTISGDAALIDSINAVLVSHNMDRIQSVGSISFDGDIPF